MLKLTLQLWETYQQKIAQCDHQIERVLRELAGLESPGQRARRGGGKPGGPNTPQIENRHARQDACRRGRLRH